MFEGFINYLSYLTLKNGKSPKADVLILNSVSNLPKSLDYLKPHKEIYTFLDNDDAGRSATQTIKSVCTIVHDQAPKYSKYKDINDLLCRKEVLNECRHETNQSRLHDSMTSVNQSVTKNKPGRRMKF
ncbi:MAG: toprim domain-containing protein [Tannerellaceae bacterium]|nr:toprim domain-containing protein [Tannerellaceae bacterium]